MQEIEVNATEGRYYAEAPVSKTILEVGESPERVREALEGHEALEGEMYGPGNIEVTSPCTGAPNPACPEVNNPYEVYEIKFVGKFADRHVELMEVPARAAGTKVAVKELTAGGPDGLIVVTAVNLGNEEVNAKAQPIAIKDQLPPGLEAVEAEGAADEGFGGANLGQQLACSVESSRSVGCSWAGTEEGSERHGVPPLQTVQVRIGVRVVGSAPAHEVNESEINAASVSGGVIAGVSVRGRCG